jgi:hypothetical protein
MQSDCSRSMPLHELRLAHDRNRFSMFRIYYALEAGLIKGHDIEWTVTRSPTRPAASWKSV